MSTFREHRCQNCGVRYTYQPSGYGGLQPNNHADYCPGCYQVVQAALQAVPPRSEQVWIGTSDVTVEDLVAQEQAAWEETKAQGQVPVQRVLPPLFDLERPSNQHMQGIVRRDGRTYRYEYWTERGGMAAGRVYVEVERDVATGQITGPWRLADRWVSTPTFIEHPEWPERPAPTHEWTPSPLLALKVQQFPLVESQSLAGIKFPRRPGTFDYGKIGRSLLVVEELPRGALPIYDKDPDITAVVTGDADDDTE